MEEHPPAKLRHIKDAIHDYIQIHPTIADFIDTPQFQRLRYLKQLGTCYYVFPGATHNRFEHCIGTSYLAGMMVEKIRDKQPELNITERDVLCVKLAALCHDLGHGPFSHVFDGRFMARVRPNSTWTHEEGSIIMLKALAEDPLNRIDSFDPNVDIEFIGSLILGEKRDGEKGFLYEIVANKRNSLDVDKFDYIARDSKQMGINVSHDAFRLINSARVINNEICYDYKEVYNVYELFHSRFSLHKRIYSHKTSRAIELMIIDCFEMAEEVLQISAMVDQPSRYLYLTDSILEEIERSSDERLRKSRDLILRIRRRDLYRLVDEVLISENEIAMFKDWERQFQWPEHLKDQVHVDTSKINYGFGAKNPLEHMKFYGKDPNVSYRGRQRDISLLLPKFFQEHVMRVFVKDGDYHGEVQKCFRDAIDPIRAAQRRSASSDSISVSPSQLMRTPSPELGGNPAFTVNPSYRTPKRGSRTPSASAALTSPYHRNNTIKRESRSVKRSGVSGRSNRRDSSQEHSPDPKDILVDDRDIFPASM